LLNGAPINPAPLMRSSQLLLRLLRPEIKGLTKDIETIYVQKCLKYKILFFKIMCIFTVLYIFFKFVNMIDLSTLSVPL
jgi:hypothetical protein